MREGEILQLGCRTTKSVTYLPVYYINIIRTNFFTCFRLPKQTLFEFCNYSNCYINI